ncbi:class I SAM-dependent methyltransferase [Paraglaciecola chathamensis]|jgi:predicted methyltransferase|uniref:Methyltransferase n=4 Tax=Paraglaciecola chathamensis TaxID=368405 RepID=A0A8H9LZU1_9ALTE|nr:MULTISPECIES: class I SAM-dependent methyltransferase [Paraglaciecola]GAC11388.1 hypothetical protein GCHA_3458 [Paraglaciecola chathamensis S18K6]GGZ53007.1 methyltransferase [Paraglaciecola oceanifecundans]
MRTKATLTLLAAFILSSFITHAKTTLSSEQISALLSSAERPVQDAARDESRQPEKILAFTGVGAGQHVLDFFAGGGWYSELFSKAVEAQGKVYVQNDEVIWRFAEKGLNERTKQNRLNNLVRFDNMPIVDMTIPENSLDLVFTALNYHDLFFTHSTENGKNVMLRDTIVDYKAALNKIKDAMKEDAVFVIIDHAATPGSGYDAANNLHRIDPAVVKFQMQEAGFKLIEEAFYLRNPNDDLNTLVFDPSVRGTTDRFVYKFTKL